MSHATSKLPVSRVLLATGLVAAGLATVIGWDDRCAADRSRRPADNGTPTWDGEVSNRNKKAPREQSLGVADRGIFSDLDPKVQIALPGNLKPERLRAAVDRSNRLLVLYDTDHPIKIYPLGGPSVIGIQGLDSVLALRPGDRQELEPLLDENNVLVYDRRVTLPPGDRDGDGIPDPLDVLAGARKTALNGALYDERYQRLKYPGGDVPRNIGVCTDVVVRALRNAGYDLQKELREDLARTRRAYPMVKRPNPSIDHRRVKTLLPLFKRRFDRRAARLDDPDDPLRPGDVVFMDTFPNKPGPDHIGIVSDTTSKSGLPLIINNWTNGTRTGEMDLLRWVPVTHRFRVGSTDSSSPISPLATQLLTVRSDSWPAYRAKLRRYQRDLGSGSNWKRVGKPIDVVLGRAGYGWGHGLHGIDAPNGRTGPVKREGDGRSPAGVFALGKSYGYEARPPGQSRLSYQKATTSLRCVDDPNSAFYNQVVDELEVKRDWDSAEHMRRSDELYELTVFVEHNTGPAIAEAGSCIFLHVWAGPDNPMSGCTAAARENMATLMEWLRPNRALLVALPQPEYRALQPTWNLPDN